MNKSLLLINHSLLVAIGVLMLIPSFAGKPTYVLYAALSVLGLAALALAITLKLKAPAHQDAPVPAPEPKEVPPETHQPNLQKIPEQNGEVQVAQLLSLLQEKGRFLDFVMDDIKSYSDAQVAAAARFVHQGCQGVMKQNFTIEPVSSIPENDAITLPADYERGDYSLSGEVSGEPPHSGTLKHKGWKAQAISLPKVMGARAAAKGSHLLVPAEVEVR